MPFLLGGERAACEHCLAKRGESSHSTQAMVGERLGAPAIKFVNSTSGRSKPLPYGQAQGARIFKSACGIDDNRTLILDIKSKM